MHLRDTNPTLALSSAAAFSYWTAWTKRRLDSQVLQIYSDPQQSLDIKPVHYTVKDAT